MNRLVELNGQGTSVWLDFISRELLASGRLKSLVAAGEVRGVTSNPTIFQKAIGGSADYDASIRESTARGLAVEAVLDELMVRDIREA